MRVAVVLPLLLLSSVCLSRSSAVASAANTTQEKCSTIEVCFRNGDFYDPCTVETDNCPPCVDLVYTYHTCYEKTAGGDCSLHFDCSASWGNNDTNIIAESSSSSAAVTAPQAKSSNSNSASLEGSLASSAGSISRSDLSATFTIIGAAICVLAVGC